MQFDHMDQPSILSGVDVKSVGKYNMIHIPCLQGGFESYNLISR